MVRLKVSGMTCGHCEASVREALAAVPGVTKVVAVDRNRSEAVVEGTAETAALVSAVKQEGYDAEPET